MAQRMSRSHAPPRGVASTGRYRGGGRDDPSALALPTAYSHPLYDEELHVNVGLAQLFQRGIVRVVVPCLSQLKRRKL